MLYIDSGTGSMIFSFVIAAIATVVLVIVVPIVIWLLTRR